MTYKPLILILSVLPVCAIASDWIYEQQTSDFASPRIQAYLSSDSGTVASTGAKSEADIVISVDKTDPFKYNPRVSLLMYNDYTSACYNRCQLLLSVDGVLQEPLTVRRLNQSIYGVSDTPAFIAKIANAQVFKIAAQTATGDTAKFEFNPSSDIDRNKLPLR